MRSYVRVEKEMESDGCGCGSSSFSIVLQADGKAHHKNAPKAAAAATVWQA